MDTLEYVTCSVLTVLLVFFCRARQNKAVRRVRGAGGGRANATTLAVMEASGGASAGPPMGTGVPLTLTVDEASGGSAGSAMLRAPTIDEASGGAGPGCAGTHWWMGS